MEEPLVSQYDWISSTHWEELLSYGKAVPDEKAWVIEEISEELLTTYYLKRRQFFRSINSNALLVLSESAVLILLDKMAAYNMPSVKRKYKQKYNQLELPEALRGNQLEDLQRLRLAYLHIFQLKIIKEYIRLSIYLTSCIHIGLDVAIAEKTYELCTTLAKEMEKDLEKSHYLRHQLNPDQKLIVGKIFSNLRFFPYEQSESLINGDGTALIFSYAADLALVLGSYTLSKKTETEDETQYLYDLTENLALNEQLTEIAKQDDLKALSSEDPTLEKWGQLTSLLISLDQITDPQTEYAFKEFFASLSTDAKQEYEKDLIEFFSTNPLVEAIFDPLDPEGFIVELKETSLNFRKNYIDSLSTYVSIDQWPSLQKVMTALGKIL